MNITLVGVIIEIVLSVPMIEKQQSSSFFEGSVFLKLNASHPSRSSEMSRRHTPVGIFPF